MYVKYGEHQFDAGEVGLSTSREGIFVDGMAKSVIETFFCSGQLHAADADALTTAINLMQTRLAVQGQNFGLYQDNGTATSVYRASADCLGGLRVIGPVSFTDLRRAEYTTFVNYTFTIQGEVFNPSVAILSWQEDIRIHGGGPQYVWQTYLEGLPQRQVLYQNTPYMATQSGSAVGYLGRPLAPQPLWPDALLPTESDYGTSSPRRIGPVGSPSYVEFGISWSYSFMSPYPFFGSPHVSPQI